MKKFIGLTIVYTESVFSHRFGILDGIRLIHSRSCTYGNLWAITLLSLSN